MWRIKKIWWSLFVGAGLVAWMVFLGAREMRIISKSHVGTCTKINSTTLKLSGKIDQHMNDCASIMLTDDITDVIADSPGGDVVYGRTIGYIIGSEKRTLHVENYCGSSCANYFIPSATKLNLSENAVIMLHGTPDPFTVLRPYRDIDKTVFMEEVYDNYEINIVDEHTATSIWKGDPLKRPSEKEGHLRIEMERLSNREEEKFSKRFDVPFGWRLYRDENSTMDGWLKHFEYTQFTDSKSSYLWVEKPMLESCLPNVELIENSNQQNRSILGKILLNISHTKTKDLRCVMPK